MRAIEAAIVSTPTADLGGTRDDLGVRRGRKRTTFALTIEPARRTVGAMALAPEAVSSTFAGFFACAFMR